MKRSMKIWASALSLSFLVGCGTSPLLLNQRGVSPRFQAQQSRMGVFKNSRFNRFSNSNNHVNLTDNFTAYMAQRTDELGMDGEPIPVLEGQAVQALPLAKGATRLTYLTYEALDNNLYHDLNPVLEVLEGVGSNRSMNLLAQTDSFGQQNTGRYFIQPAKAAGVQSPYKQLTGPQNEDSGNPNTFAQAINWGFGNYPSQIKWLNLSTHGNSFAGINYDDSPNSSMNIMTFKKAVQNGMQGKKLDLISFDACLMATVEVASELQSVANTLIASEDVTTYWGFGYAKTFARLAKNPNMAPDQIARSLVMDVHNKGHKVPYHQGGKTIQTPTISATNLKKISLLEREIDTLARALRKALPTQRAAIVRAVKRSQPLAWNEPWAPGFPEDMPSRDLNRLLHQFKLEVKDSAVQQAIQRINHLMYRKGLILFSRQSRQEKDQGRGLAIYLPQDGEVSKLYRQTHFAKVTQWDEFLLELSTSFK